MNKAKINGVEIAWLEAGEGQPVVLVHGFASNAKTNWFGTGWMQELVKAGYRVVAIDNRGHGNSEKFYDEDHYTLDKMAGDVSGLIDHLGLERPHVMGYSMGSRISVTLFDMRASDLGKLVIAGNGYNMIEGGMDTGAVREALLAGGLEEAGTVEGRTFREFAEKVGNDLKALAACIRGHTIDKSVFEGIGNEALVIVGDEDTLAIDAHKIAEIMPNARFEPIPKRNHMNAVGDKVYKQKVIEFLSE